MTGAVRSIFTVTDFVAVPPPLTALQVSVVPLVSSLRMVVSQPVREVIEDSGSFTDHVTVTRVLFHPFALGSGETRGSMTGAVVSPAGGGLVTVTPNVAAAKLNVPLVALAVWIRTISAWPA